MHRQKGPETRKCETSVDSTEQHKSDVIRKLEA